MIEILSLLILVWSMIQPYVFGTFVFIVGFLVVFFLWGVIQHLIAIQDHFRNVLWHLSSLKEVLEQSRVAIENVNNEMKTAKDSLSEVKESICNIEKELDWWSDKNTLAKQIMKRLDAIDRR